MVERYPTQTLLGMFSEIKRPKRYLLERFFPREQTFSTEEVMFDKILETRRLAPFVSWHVKGKPMPRAGEELKPFKPPYVKPKFALTPDLAIKTMPGESLQGSMSPQQRIDRIRTQMLQEQDDMITRREEWMASELLRTGTLTVTAEDHPPMTINLGRPSGHTIALTTTACVSPYQNLRTWAGTVAAAAGVAPTEVIMDPLAATLLLQDPYIKTIFNIQNYQPPQSTINLLGSLAVPDEVQPLGSFGGFNFFQYQSTYLNADGTVGQYMPDYTAILASPTGANGVRTYGAIMDHGRPVPASRFPKEWVDEDPSVHWLMTQSAPLPLLERPKQHSAQPFANTAH